MSNVVVQVGQCGNQLGQHFWKQVLKDKQNNDSHGFVHYDGKFHSVNVDSEPKVVKRLLKDNKQSNFRKENVILGKRGRGTNWALGYNGPKSGDDRDLLGIATEAIRKEVERCDSFSGIVMVHSISGGTGSGVGAHLSEILRDEYPLAYQLSCVVAPHATGESPLQHYNSLLCLSWLQRFSDSIMFFQNDDILYRLNKRLKSDGRSVSFNDMNLHIAACMAGVMLPVDSVTPKCGMSIGMEPWEMIRSICPIPTTKFIHINQLNKSKLSWDELTSQVLHTVKRHDSAGKTFSSIANLVIARGDTTRSFPGHMTSISQKVKATYSAVTWNPFPVDFWIARHNSIGAKDSASVTIASNYSNVLDVLERTVRRSQQMYDAGAYLHWYWKHGLEKDVFESSFETIETVIKNYKDAVS
ncbi:unnamed protein product [Owenia fusiformis]|uniref:Tubulin delta chain n=1 Tax=Owenia fusiformis TaxID=6347 RepID=A0A8J1Y5T7_OWEFU|nr:unnamed protein product [Owenia fusiformis]